MPPIRPRRQHTWRIGKECFGKAPRASSRHSRASSEVDQGAQPYDPKSQQILIWPRKAGKTRCLVEKTSSSIWRGRVRSHPRHVATHTSRITVDFHCVSDGRPERLEEIYPLQEPCIMHVDRHASSGSMPVPRARQWWLSLKSNVESRPQHVQLSQVSETLTALHSSDLTKSSRYNFIY